jgi:hypothetical protein
MGYTIKLDHENKLVRYKHTGNILGEEIEQAWMEFLSMKEFTEMNYNLMSDYRDSTFDMHHNEVSMIIEFMKKIEHIVRGKKQSLIVDNPYSTATSEIFAERVYEATGFKVELFSTPEAALEWLRS